MASSRNMDKPQGKSRRSWFDAPPLTTLDPQQNRPISRQPRPKQKSPDSVESLTLTHFSSVPRLSFGKVKFGKTKFRNLLIRNPHDYEQEVIVERFPFKKYFGVEFTRFMVEPNSVFDFEISWTPEEEINVREMILFHVNGVYRVQAYVFGSCEKPKAPRKVRKGVLGPRVNQPTFVVQTPALSKIKSSYDRNSLEFPSYNEGVFKKGSELFRATEDVLRQQSSGPKETTTVKASCGKFILSKENVRPGEEVHHAISPLESTSVEGRLNEDQGQLEHRWLSDMTCPSLNVMSPIQVIGEVEKGFVVDSYFKSNETTAAEESQVIATMSAQAKATDLRGTFLCPQISCSRAEAAPFVSSTVTEPDTVSTTLLISETDSNQQSVSDSRNHRTISMERKMRMDWSSPQVTPESPAFCPRLQVSPNTQLNQSLSLISQMSTPQRRHRPSPQSGSDLECSVISQGLGLVSPNSFMEDMKSFQQGSARKRMREDSFVASHRDSPEGTTATVDVPSPSRILRNTIPHNLMVEHLHSVQTSLNSSSGSFVAARTPLKPNRPHSKRRSISSRFREKEQQKATPGDEDVHPRTRSKRPTEGRQGFLERNEKLAEKRLLRKGIVLASKSAVAVSAKRSPKGKKSGQKKKSPVCKVQTKAGMSRRSPWNKKRLSGSHKVQSSFVQENCSFVDIDELKLPSSGAFDSLTPIRPSLSSVDDRTVVKSRNSEFCCPDPSHGEKSTRESSGRDNLFNNNKALFSDKLYGESEVTEMRRGSLEIENLTQQNLASAFVPAIDRKEIFVDRAGNAVGSGLDCSHAFLQYQRKTTEDGHVIFVLIESIDATPNETRIDGVGGDSPAFHTPTTALPNTYDPQMTRRSTHIVRSPKILNLSAMQQRCLVFDQTIGQEVDRSLSSRVLNKSTRGTSSIHEREITDTPPGIVKDSVDGNSGIAIISQSYGSESPTESCLSISSGHPKSEMNGSDCDTSLTVDSLNTSNATEPSKENFSLNSEVACCAEGQLPVPAVNILLLASSFELHPKHREETSVTVTEPSPHIDVVASDFREETKSVGGSDTYEKLPMVNDSELASSSAVPVESVVVNFRDNDDCFSKPTDSDVIQRPLRLHRRSISTGALHSHCIPSELGEESQLGESEHSELYDDDRLISKPDAFPEVSSIHSFHPQHGQVDIKAHVESISKTPVSPRNGGKGRSSSRTDFKAPLGNGKKMGATVSSSQLNARNNEGQRSTSSTSVKIVTPTARETSLGFYGRSQSVDCLNTRKTKADKTVPVTLKKSIGRQREATNVRKVAGEEKKGISVKAVIKTAKGVAPSRLILVKKSKTASARHPMPFAARNMYYDERWKEKQERGFVQWLNFVLTPPDEYVAVSTQSKIDAGSLALSSQQVAPRLAPTKEILSFRAYAARRRLNRLRRAACELYQSESVVPVIKKVEVEVESGRLLVRKEKMIHADLGIKQTLLHLLLQYSSLWLRVGLETIFGEMLMLQSNTDVMGLSRFILTRLLGCPDIAEEYAHATVPHLYKEGYAAALSRHSLKKFLLLVFFLDQAKSARLIDHDPCLFNTDATVKSSKEILVELSREILSGEGDLVRHLAYLGYNVSHTQKAIDEFDYAVINLSTDLKDGLRLSRVVELLAGDSGIIRRLRAPAISRLQKVHNVDVFFQVMKASGLDYVNDQQISSRDVVDGHREKTLSLLWHLILHFQACIQVNEDDLQEEINLLTKSLRLKLAMQKIGVLHFPQCLARRDSSDGQQSLPLSARMQLIFRWCQLVCLHYGVKIDNFTVSFSDGRAFCCLLHHYHPALLSMSEIHFQTTQSFQSEADALADEADADDSVDFSAKHNSGLLEKEADPAVFQRLLANEKANFKVLYEKVSALGGVPLMVKSTDMSNTIPDEKVVSTYVAYLCARLLDIRLEVRAARVIQMAWRRRKVRRDFGIRQKAVSVIQRSFRKYLSKKRALEKKMLEQKKKEMEIASIIIQRFFRRQTDRKHFLRKRQAVVTIQRQWRVFLMAREERRQRLLEIEMSRIQNEAASIIQRSFRGLLNRKVERERKSATCIQIWWRGHKARKLVNDLKLDLRIKSVTIIQKWTRRMICMKRYKKIKSSVLAIQTQWRMVTAQRRYQLLRKERTRAVLIIQKFYRARECSRRFNEMKRSAVVIQCCWRSHKARLYASSLRMARCQKMAVVIQRTWRCHHACSRFNKKKSAVIVIQKYCRGWLAKREAHLLREERKWLAAVRIQASVRRWLSRKDFLQLKRSAVVVQRAWRQRLVVRYLDDLKAKRDAWRATQIQAAWRRWVARRNLLMLKAAALTVQRAWRKKAVIRYLTHLKTERDNWRAVQIQAAWRGSLARRDYLQMKQATVILQKTWRMRQAMKEFGELKSKRDNWRATQIQAAWRGFVARRDYLQMRQATVILQKTWRMRQAMKEFGVLKSKRDNARATQIQAMWRGCIARGKYLRLKRAATNLQKVWRMKVAVRELDILRSERDTLRAIQIQAIWRGFVVRREFLRMRQAAVFLQKTWRMRQAIKELDSLKSNRDNWRATQIQAAWRGYLARKFVQEKKAAVISIQTYWKMFCQRQTFNQQKMAAITIQRSVRAMLLARHTRHDYVKLRVTVVFLQSLVRRKKALQDFWSKRRAAVIIQSSFRMYKRRIKYLAVRLATTIVQRAFRNYRDGRLIRQHYLAVRRSAIVLQRHYRRHLHVEKRKREISATVIQAAVRRFLQQSIFRRQKHAAILIQNRFRASQAMKKVRREYDAKKEAAVVIQSFFRMHLAQKFCFNLKITEQKNRESAVKIQSFFKMCQARREYDRQRESIIFLQRQFRNILKVRLARAEFMHYKTSIVKLQSLCRMCIARKDFHSKRDAAIRLQAFARRIQAMRKFQTSRGAAIFIQRYFRGWKIGQACRSEFLSLKESTFVIQRFYRRRILLKEKEKLTLLQHAAAIKIQSFYKGRTQRKVYVSLMASVICIQKKFRAIRQGRFDRLKFEETRKACTVIQRVWRRYCNVKTAKAILQQRRFELEEERRQEAVEEARALCRNNSASVIQTAFRRFMIVRRQERLVAAKHNAATLLQATVRGYLTRRRVEPLMTEWIQRLKEVRLQQKSALKIQTLWRGYVVRRDTTNKKLKLVRRRVESINRSATEEKTLGYRTASALDYLFEGKDVAFILETLVHLDVATRLSPVCCERVVEVNATSVLVRLISSCNRSIPHMDIIRYCVDILLNLAKYHKTVDSILAVPDATLVLLNLMQIYREKGAIFLKTCHLLSILAQDTHRRQVIMACERIAERLQSIRTLVLRKHKTHQSQQATKAKMAAMKTGNSTLPVSALFGSSPSKRPAVCPQWNLSSKNKMKELDNPVTAIALVLESLRIWSK